MEGKSLVIFFSWAGNTRTVARLIQKETGGDLFELLPVKAYPRRYSKCTEQGKREIQSSVLPELQGLPSELSSYDTVFVGTPNWWSTMAPPVLSFLAKSDLAGKRIVPFCTHGGGGKGHIFPDMGKECPESTLLEGLDLYDNGGGQGESAVRAWLGRIG